MFSSSRHRGFGGRKGGHVMCGCNYLIIVNWYHITQAIRWDPQTQNGGWVGAWTSDSSLRFLFCYRWVGVWYLECIKKAGWSFTFLIGCGHQWPAPEVMHFCAVCLIMMDLLDVDMSGPGDPSSFLPSSSCSEKCTKDVVLQSQQSMLTSRSLNQGAHSKW